MAGDGVGVAGAWDGVGLEGLLLGEELVELVVNGGGGVVGNVEGTGADELELGVLDEIGKGIRIDI